MTPRRKKTLSKKGKRETKKLSPSLLTKPTENPIILPIEENGWEAWQTFNPGVILLKDKVHFMYRAIGEDGISRFGYASSGDGFKIDERLPHPVYKHHVVPSSFTYYSLASGGSWGGCEDPRIVRVNEEDTLYMTYTVCDNGLQVALTSIKLGDFLAKKWDWKRPVLISPQGEFHKNWLIFPEKINGKYAILLGIVPEIEIAYFDNLDFDETQYIHSTRPFGVQKNTFARNSWDKWIRGPGAPPLKTKDGWLLFYHAMDNDWSKYKVGAMLLDLDDPTKVLCRSKEPVLEPDEDYENNGFKAGIVYVSGAVIKNGELLVYYGASDSYVSVAHAHLEEFLRALTRKITPRLKTKTLKKK